MHCSLRGFKARHPRAGSLLPVEQELPIHQLPILHLRSMSSATATAIGKGGQLFFGSLCVGTFGLGCWQLQRLVEKQSLIEERSRQLALEPIRGLPQQDSDSSSYRRVQLEGTFQHEKEVLIGPRGAPNGVTIPRQGLSAAAGKQSAGGAAPGPQGYHILTPLQLHGDSSRQMVWINRGWVPKTLVPKTDGRKKQQQSSSLQLSDPQWKRPAGTVQITSVPSKPEEPKLIAPEHDYSKRPLQLFWIDGVALQALAESKEETMLLVQVADEDAASDDGMIYPLRPPAPAVAQFKTTPAIHAGYAATWFGLSGAGIYMTRKLLTKGRW